jgi:O-antigen/teichoic acid export membrane protein
VNDAAHRTFWPDAIVGRVSPTSARQAGAYLGTRAANGALALLQLLLVTVAVGPAEAGRFFLLWTAAWLLTVVGRFGVDGILPRAVAEGRLSGSPIVSIRRVLVAGLVAGVILLPPVFAVLGVPLDPLEVGLVIGLAACWAANGIVASLLKAHGRADLSGLVGNVLWPLGPALAPVVVILAGGGWVTIAVFTLIASAASLAAALAVAIWGLGTATVLGLGRRGGRAVPVDRDEAGAALLTTLYEVVIWLPVLLGGMLGIDPAAAAGLFAATRIAGLFSWGYQAVLTVLVPRIAAAFASRDAAAAREVLLRGSVAGMVVTWPLCLLGVLLARHLLEIFDSRYDTWSEVLVLLILARAVDSATGPLGEALLVGRRTWVDVALVSCGVALGAIGAAVLYDPVGDLAIGIGGAGAFIVTNLLRVVYVSWMLREIDPRPRRDAGEEGAGDAGRLRGFPRARQGRGAMLAGAALLGGGVLGLVSLTSPPAGEPGVLLSVGAAVLAALGLLALAASQFGWRTALSSPLAIVGLVLVCIFALRPLALMAEPRSAARGLVFLGFSWRDLAGAIGLGTVGLVSFGGAFLAAWRFSHERVAPPPRLPAERKLARATLAALGAGSALWGALFLKNGGFGALLEDPARLHLGQFGGGYGVFGYMLCLAAALLVLWTWLQHPTPLLARMLVAAIAVSVIAAFALQTRGPLITSIAAGLVIVVLERRPSGRRLFVLAAVVLLLASAFAYMRTVREYAQSQPLGSALKASARTDPVTVFGGDFTELDNLVALRLLVPDGLRPLSGRSLWDVPAAFVPRRLWGGKPLPVDYELSRALFGRESRAGTPFTLVGEFFWNYGIAGVLVGMTLLGGLGGVGWRALRNHGGGLATVAGALVVGYSYLLLTRPLGPMLLTAVMALVALCLVAALAGLIQRRDLRWIPGYSASARPTSASNVE